MLSMILLQKSALDPDTTCPLPLRSLEGEASEFFSSGATILRQIQLALTKAVMKLQTAQFCFVRTGGQT
jgi:hypothetical protein